MQQPRPCILYTVKISFDFSLTHEKEEYMEQICPNAYFVLLSCSHLSETETQERLIKAHTLGAKICIGTRGSKGSICYDGNDIKKINKYTFRSKYIGVVFQSFNLVTKFTAVENVVLSMEIAGVKGINKKKKAYELLESVGLDTDEANRRVLKLSGGQQQRVAIGRALSYDAQVLLADEPTGNLDSDTQQDILQIFRSLADSGKCVILVSHSSEVAKACDQIYTLQRISGKSARR